MKAAERHNTINAFWSWFNGQSTSLKKGMRRGKVPLPERYQNVGIERLLLTRRAARKAGVR